MTTQKIFQSFNHWLGNAGGSSSRSGVITTTTTNTTGVVGAGVATTQGATNGTIWANNGVLTFGPELTQQEKDELQLLKEEREQRSKELKIAAFKELHPEMRQMVICLLLWQDNKESIDTLEADMTDRERELTNKDNMSGRIYSSIGTIDAWSGMFFPMISLPKGLTKEDLIEAHTAASMEEVILE